MSQNINLLRETITRRSFLQKTLIAGLVLIGAKTVGTVLSGCAAAPPTADLTITSSTDFNHSHKVTILGADIDRPPAQKTYTSDGASHQHAITLTKANFDAIKKKQEVSVVSTSTGTTPHTHTFAIKIA
ncbi:MAG: hypothetical protein HY665_10045 [Chloroflexi bacterium]|nr:hypothetical protein [Chloroflexota bacterium]